MKRFLSLFLVLILSLSFTSNASEREIEVSTMETPSYEVTVSFAGDCTIGEYKGQGVGNQYKDYFNKNGANYFLQNVKPIFESDDLTFVNLEGALTDRPQVVDKKYPIRCESEHVSVLSGSSIEVVNLSNNHIYDCGVDGFEDTKKILTENNIGYCGEGNEYVTTVNGIQISFLGYQGWSNTKSLRDRISNDILNARLNGSMIVCVQFHFGVERENYSNSIQEILAHHAIDSGADIVVGTHPHVVQGIEVYNGKTICYSLGNFTFGANKNPSDKDTFIYQQTFKLTPNGVEYSNHTVIPCSISSETNRNNYQPTPLIGNDYERVIGRLRAYSSRYSDTLSALK